MNSTARSTTTNKKTLTLVLNDAEMDVLESLSTARSLSKVAVLRQALRLYQTVDVRQQRGEKLFFENEASKEKAELMLL
ncbi:transcriptional regulator [Caballeronia sp. GACF4]|uniref:transcriptional regulator n=1 Tax=Caballeronia sp. GACF4 TaxID=2921763 RepID=UPI002028EC4B|nr:transcriptional regulator [Caballeronia sp. GACF4]